MSDTFTWLSKFGDVCELLDEPDRKELVYALAMYGMYGEEPELPFHLKIAFAAMREDVDYSKTRRTSGSKGGRPKASKKDGKAPSEDAGNLSEKVPEKVPENLCEKVPENVTENPKQSRARRGERKPGAFAHPPRRRSGGTRKSAANRSTRGASATSTPRRAGRSAGSR